MGPRIKHRKPCLKKGAWWSMSYVMLWAQRSKSSELGGYCLRWSMAILDPTHWPLWPSCFRASQVALVVKDTPASLGDVRDAGLIPGSGRSPGEGHGNPLQYFFLENSIYRAAWRAMVHRLHRVGHDWSNLAYTHILYTFIKSQRILRATLSYNTLTGWPFNTCREIFLSPASDEEGEEEC